MKRGHWKRWKRWLALCWLGLAAAGSYHYVAWDTAAGVAGLVALLLIPVVPTAPRYPLRWGIASIVLFGLWVLLPVKTTLYFFLAAAIFFYRESFYGKMPPSAVLAIPLLSPLTEYALDAFSFPIRLWLTKIAGGVLQHIEPGMQVKGNMLQTGNADFSVDPACMGLHMLMVSLLTVLLLVNLYQRRYGRIAGWMPMLGLLCLGVFFNLGMNVLRIIMLVSFRIFPSNPMHGAVGLVCLAVYVILPMVWLSKRVVMRYGKPMPEDTAGRPGGESRLVWMNGVFVLAMTVAVIVRYTVPETFRGSEPTASVAGYSIKPLGKHVLALENDHTLVYLKFIRDFYYTSHQPTICWRGSGYNFQRVEEESIAGQKMYTGELVNGTGILYTAWWFDNGVHRTIGQFDWRWDVMKGARKYALVNITAASRKEMEAAVREAIERKVLNPLLEAGY